jgi:Na+(H+)/acetate symporter ActP
MVGILVFVYYLFTPAPLLFNPDHAARVEQLEPAAYAALQTEYDGAFERRRQAASAVAAARAAGDATAVDAQRGEFRAREAEVRVVRDSALALAGRVTGENPRDVNYIIPRFALAELPPILTGIFIAAVLAAAMSSIAAELNSLSTATVIDFYKRWFRQEAPDSHFLRVSKVATGFWGLFACLIATWAVALGSLIEVVNRFGSFFYGSILGVFLLAMIPMARGLGAFVGLIAGMASVAAVTYLAPSISFLWHNVIGAGVVVFVGLLLSIAGPAGREPPPAVQARQREAA